MEVSIRSNLYEAGLTEDGEAFIAEVFLVVIELADGSRYEHGHRFPGAEADEFGFNDVREDAEAKAQALADAIVAAGSINTAYWVPLEARYGSQAYEAEVAAMTPAQRGYGS